MVEVLLFVTLQRADFNFGRKKGADKRRKGWNFLLFMVSVLSVLEVFFEITAQ